MKDEGGASVWAGLQPLALARPKQSWKALFFLLGRVMWLAHVNSSTRA